MNLIERELGGLSMLKDLYIADKLRLDRQNRID